MAEFYGYFSLRNIDGIDFLAILYHREDHSLAARKFICIPSYADNFLQDSHLFALPMVKVEDEIIDVNFQMIRFPVFVARRSFFHTGDGNLITFRERQSNVYGIAKGCLFEFGYWNFPCTESTRLSWDSTESFLIRGYTIRVQIEKNSQGLFTNISSKTGVYKHHHLFRKII